VFVTKTPRAEGVPRRTFPFDASAQVTVGNSDPVDARVREFSLYGCFLKFSILLVPGTPVFVKIFSESDIFEASGTVIYFQHNVGFGFGFRDIKPNSLAVLQKWLSLAREKYESQAR
jgi:PilZ domain